MGEVGGGGVAGDAKYAQRTTLPKPAAVVVVDVLAQGVVERTHHVEKQRFIGRSLDEDRVGVFFAREHAVTPNVPNTPPAVPEQRSR